MALLLSKQVTRPLTATTSQPLSDIHVKKSNPTGTTFIAYLRLGIPDFEIRNQAYRMISTGELNTLLHLHRQPINVVVFHDPQGELILGNAWRLDAFSAYHART